MSANELADELDKMIPVLPLNVLIKSATMLRLQQAEIEALKKELQQIKIWCGKTQFKHDYSSPFIELQKASEKRTCNKCNDTGWVCEWHPDKEAHKCCGGAGMPCECIGGEA